MEIKTGIISEKDQVMALYDDAGWTAYTDEPDLLMEAIKNSLKVWTLWDGEKLIGLARTIGDGATISYLQDILILKAYQDRGLGSDLLKEIMKENEKIRQFVLLTEDSEKTKGFYKKLGLSEVGDFSCLAFMW
ncbi:GNAT family N-acetyltransferase [uncultured Anaerococcus sp.]|uniref:GNAT family N-acetyltransferase n=1 Tax=uncultured Anaerococcus sp. TaxID=293428 RepID=UPI0028059EFE|nr:GNAT family N-acetyltransferase [uncultured Anaerococcus sp.]